LILNTYNCKVFKTQDLSAIIPPLPIGIRIPEYRHTGVPSAPNENVKAADCLPGCFRERWTCCNFPLFFYCTAWSQGDSGEPSWLQRNATASFWRWGWFSRAGQNQSWVGARPGM